MLSPFSLASFVSELEARAYAFLSSWSVYVGLVRAGLQERLPFLQKHGMIALGGALLVVVGIQSLIALLSLLTLAWNALHASLGSIGLWVHALPIVSFFREER